jgi:hypothetical protein
MDSALSPAPPAAGLRSSRVPGRRSPVVAGLLGWLVPGLGHVYVGQPLKALLLFAAIVPTFTVGLALTDYTCVNPQKYGLEFVAHAWLGGPTILALHGTRDHVLEWMPRWFDVGRLYAAIAGLLNVVALSDVLGAALARNRVVDRLRRRVERVPDEWVELLPPLVEIDGRERLFSAVDEAVAGNGPAAEGAARPAIPGEVVLDPEEPR